MSRLGILCPASPRPVDGVLAYARALAAALDRHVPTALLVVADVRAFRSAGGSGSDRPVEQVVAGWRDVWRARAEAPWWECDTWIVQYVPQVFWRSVAREWTWWALWCFHRRLVRRNRFVLTLHEYNVPWRFSIRRVAARVMFDALLALLAGTVSCIVVTHGYNERSVSRLLFWRRRRIRCIPVGGTISAMAPAPVADVAARRRPEEVSGVIFGSPAAMSPPLVTALGRWLAARHGRMRLTWVTWCRDAAEEFWRGRCGLPVDRLEVAAGMPDAAVSAILSSADFLVAPIVDGVSTRRTTVATALAHGLPIVGTDGPCTDPVFRESDACALAEVSDADGFVARVAEVASDAGRRTRMREAARALYDAHFAWSRIAAAYLQALSDSG